MRSVAGICAQGGEDVNEPTEIVLPAVRIDGFELTFFESLRGPHRQRRLAAALLTWLEFATMQDNLLMAVYEHAHARLTEDGWYRVAQRIFRQNYESLGDGSLQDALQALAASADIRALGPSVLNLLQAPQPLRADRHENSTSIRLH
jgi:hypothetical protein